MSHVRRFVPIPLCILLTLVPAGCGEPEPDGEDGCIRELGSAESTLVGTGQCLFVDSRHAYLGVADNNVGLQIFNIEDPAAPVALGALSTDHDVFGIDVVGDVAYLASNQGGLVLVDLSDPTTPAVLGGVSLSPEAWSVEVLGQTAFVTSFDQGLVSVDVSDPANPVVAGALPLSGNSHDIHVVGETGYVVSETHFQIVDLTAREAPALLAELASGTMLYEVWSDGSYAYAVDKTERQLLTFDVANPSSPSLLGATAPDELDYRSITGEGGYLYVGVGAALAGGVKIFDLSDPASPELVDEADAQHRVYELHVVGGLLYTAIGIAAVQTFEVGCPGD